MYPRPHADGDTIGTYREEGHPPSSDPSMMEFTCDLRYKVDPVISASHLLHDLSPLQSTDVDIIYAQKLSRLWGWRDGIFGALVLCTTEVVTPDLVL